MVGPLGVLLASPAAATTGVGDVDGEPPGGAVVRSGSSHHRSWRRRWRALREVLSAGPAAVTTDVGEVNGRPPMGCWRQVQQRPPPELETSMAGPLGGAGDRSDSGHYQRWRHRRRTPGWCCRQVRQRPPPELETSMAGPLGGAVGRSDGDRYRSWRRRWRAPFRPWRYEVSSTKKDVGSKITPGRLA
jgi:hypothetical protein